MRAPDCVVHWTCFYYGPRGTCKSLHQGRQIMALLRYLFKLYTKRPYLHKAIIVTNQKMNAEVEKMHLGKELFYFDDDNLETLRYCPRQGCWRGNEPHKLHGAYLFIDDISNMLPATDWATAPNWLKKMMIKGRKFGIHIIATMVDPFDVVLPIRRTCDVARKFRNIWKTRDPDETMPALKHIFGWYQVRHITAEMLWKFGDLPEQMIQLRKIEQSEMHERLREMDRAWAIVYDDSWTGAVYFFNRSGRIPNWGIWRGFHCSSTDVYDTLQDVASEDE